MKFGANLNLKGHQFFFYSPCIVEMRVVIIIASETKIGDILIKACFKVNALRRMGNSKHTAGGHNLFI